MSAPEPSPGAAALVEHLTTCRPVSAAVVMQSGSADPVIAEMLAEGWTLTGVEVVAGKRIRYMQPPAAETGAGS